jgi:hypothetical protein
MILATFERMINICTATRITVALKSKLEFFEYVLQLRRVHVAGLNNRIKKALSEAEEIKKAAKGKKKKTSREPLKEVLFCFLRDAIPLVSTNEVLLRYFVLYMYSTVRGPRKSNVMVKGKHPGNDEIRENEATTGENGPDKKHQIELFVKKMQETLGHHVPGWVQSYEEWMSNCARKLPSMVMHETAHFLHNAGYSAPVYEETSVQETFEYWSTFSDCKGETNSFVCHARVLVQRPAIRRCMADESVRRALNRTKEIAEAFDYALEESTEGISDPFELWNCALKDLQLVKVLGNGSFGTVASVSSKVKPYCRATIKFEHHRSLYSLASSFVQPYVIAMIVDSPYVAKLYGFFEVPVFEKGVTATATLMELCGPSLRSEMDKRVKAPGEDFICWCLDYIRGVLLALVAIQDKRIIHRDVKPANLVLGLGGSYTVKLIDFGLALLLPKGQSSIEASIDGTYGYMSRNAKCGTFDLSSDVHSVAVIMKEVSGSETCRDRVLRFCPNS